MKTKFSTIVMMTFMMIFQWNTWFVLRGGLLWQLVSTVFQMEAMESRFRLKLNLVPTDQRAASDYGMTRLKSYTTGCPWGQPSSSQIKISKQAC